MAKPKTVPSEANKQTQSENYSSTSTETSQGTEMGQGDPVNSVSKKKCETLSRSTFPLPVKKSPKPKTAKSKFTISSTFGTPRPGIRSKSYSVTNISELTDKKVDKIPIAVLPTVMPVVKRPRISGSSIKAPKMPHKPRKSITMLELRSPMKKPDSNGNNFNYINLMESFGRKELCDNNDGFDEKYKYLAYKTYCFMLKNAWKRAKDERTDAFERIAKLQTSIIKTKTQLHVIKSLYHIERAHFDEATSKLHELKQKFSSSEELGSELQHNLKEKENLILKLEQNNDKLHLNLENVISNSNRMEILLDKKRDEASQLKNDNEFLIKQRQEMEATYTKRLNRYKTALDDTNALLDETNQELDRLQPFVEELEMKKLELDEYRYINSIQARENEELSHELKALQESVKLKNRLKRIWKCMSEKNERNWYFYVIYGTFLPALKHYDMLSI